MALKELDEEGYLDNFKTLQDKKVTCFIVKTDSMAMKNYNSYNL